MGSLSFGLIMRPKLAVLLLNVLMVCLMIAWYTQREAKFVQYLPSRIVKYKNNSFPNGDYKSEADNASSQKNDYIVKDMKIKEFTKKPSDKPRGNLSQIVKTEETTKKSPAAKIKKTESVPKPTKKSPAIIRNTDNVPKSTQKLPVIIGKTKNAPKPTKQSPPIIGKTEDAPKPTKKSPPIIRKIDNVPKPTKKSPPRIGKTEDAPKPTKKSQSIIRKTEDARKPTKKSPPIIRKTEIVLKPSTKSPEQATDKVSKPLKKSVEAGTSTDKSDEIKKSISRNSTSSERETCHFTRVDSFDPKIVKMARKYPPLSCKNKYPSLVYIENDSVLKVNYSKINDNAKAENFSFCRYRSFKKSENNDYNVKYEKWSQRFNKTIYLKPGEDFIEAECYDEFNIGMAKSYLSRIVLTDTNRTAHEERLKKHMEKFAPKETLSLLLIGIDGTSTQNFDRSMPKTKEFVTRNLNAIRLEKFNKVGLNTFPNILPMLSGHSVSYYQQNWTTKEHFDKIDHNFIWSELGKAGYYTAMDLEEKYVTAFHYLKKGWKKSPVDFYSRPLSIVLDTDKKMKSGKFCKGDNPSITFHIKFMMDLATRFNSSGSSKTPYFGFSFLTRLTHDNQNMASAADDMYYNFLKDIKLQNILNNTILVFFSDHGERFGSIRHTYNGIIEAKSPMGFLIFPPWFKSKHPDEWNKLNTNAKRLVTMFDLHATFRDLLYFKSQKGPPTPYTGIGISLFSTIPKNRTCVDAKIPTEYCNCNSLKKVNISSEIQNLMAKVITDTIMERLSDYKSECHILTPKSIHSILEKAQPKDNKKKDVFKSDDVLYHVTIGTTPGHGVFEAVIRLSKKDKKATVMGSITRLDMYKGEKDCITDPTIRPLCFCKSNDQIEQQ